MLDGVAESLKTLRGKDEVLEGTTVLADTAYFTEKNLKEVVERKGEAVIPDQQFRNRDSRFDGRPCHDKKYVTIEDFTYDENDKTYRCPCGKRLVYKGYVKLNRNSGDKWQAKGSDCNGCVLREQCVKRRGGGGKSPRTLYTIDRKCYKNLI